MCGIVGKSERHIGGVLLEGLKRLEYRGYDSAGIALIGDKQLLIAQTHRQSASARGCSKRK